MLHHLRLAAVLAALLLTSLSAGAADPVAPEKLLAYAQRPAATIAVPASQTLPSAFGLFPLALGLGPWAFPLPTLDR